MSANSQFSLRTALLATTLCCFAVASFTYANALWASAWFTLVLGSLCAAAIGAAFSQRSSRAFWLGFLATGAAYLMFIYAPVLDRRVGFWLLTTKSMAAVQLELEHAMRPDDAWLNEVTIGKGSMQDRRRFAEWSDMYIFDVLPQWSYFQIIGHSIYALLFAECGGLFATRLFAKNDGQRERRSHES